MPVDLADAKPAGYSGTPLAKKLGIKAGMRIAAVNPPPGYLQLLEPLPEALDWLPADAGDLELLHVFTTDSVVLSEWLERSRSLLVDNGTLWVSWPKKASKVPTDITEDRIRAQALPLGWVDVKVCAVDAVWSGLKLVVRKALRGTV